MTIKFVDELPTVQRGSKWQDVADQLRQRPGQWAEVHRASSHANTQGAATALRRNGDIEVARRTIDGEVVVFARAVSA